MGEPLAGWLSLREAADSRARSSALTQAVVELLPPDRPLHAVDLGTGTGSNIRYLSPKLPFPHEWLAVDRDPTLVEGVPADVEIRIQELGVLDAGLFAGAHLVTASALLDLVSPEWIVNVVAHCRAAKAAVLFALTYDGRFSCSPEEPEDASIREWFNAHQRANDKGFGQAAGPDATDAAVRAFEAAGYQVRRERSDWDLLPDEEALQRGLISGWAEAAAEIAPEQGRVIRNWLARRLAHVDDGRSRIQVGHDDLAAWPIR